VLTAGFSPNHDWDLPERYHQIVDPGSTPGMKEFLFTGTALRCHPLGGVLRPAWLCSGQATRNRCLCWQWKVANVGI